jgi:membrane associated rhomboid family serine protease
MRKFPLVTGVILAGCAAGFVVELLVGRGLGEFLLKFGLAPVALESYFRGVEGVNFFRGVLPFFSSLFLHGGFIHLLGNMLYLWLVGDVLEEWLGRTRFIALFLFGAAADLIVRTGACPDRSGLASVGVSGAVAALMGGFLVLLIRTAGPAGEGRAATGTPSRWLLALGALAWFPLQMLNRHLPLATTCQTQSPPSWIDVFERLRHLLLGKWVQATPGEAAALGLMTSFVLGMFLLSLSSRWTAPVPAEATTPEADEHETPGPDL